MSTLAAPTDAGSRYSAVAMTLHWILAALVILNLFLGLRMAGASGLAKFQIFQWHKSVGITVLVFTVLRLAWRLTHRPPPYPASMKPWEKVAASSVHWGFYALIIALPLTGWVVVSASPTNIPTLLYKTIPWPHLGFIHSLPMQTRTGLEDSVGEVHEFLAWTGIGLFFLHVGAALKHQFVNHDGVLFRMLPFGRPPRPE
jgi:cytochrome b561